MREARICGTGQRRGLPTLVASGQSAEAVRIATAPPRRRAVHRVGGAAWQGRVEAEACEGAFFFHGEIGVLVHVGGTDGLVAEPEGDDGDVDSGVEKLHGTAVAQDVGRDSFGGERRAGAARGGDVTFDDASDGGAAERTCLGCPGNQTTCDSEQTSRKVVSRGDIAPVDTGACAGGIATLVPGASR